MYFYWVSTLVLTGCCFLSQKGVEFLQINFCPSPPEFEVRCSYTELRGIRHLWLKLKFSLIMKRFHRNYYASKFCLDFSPVKTTWRAQQWLPPFYFQNDKWDYFLRRHFVTFCYNNFVDKNDVVNVWCYIFVMLLKIPQFEEDNKLNFFPKFKEKSFVKIVMSRILNYDHFWQQIDHCA